MNVQRILMAAGCLLFGASQALGEALTTDGIQVPPLDKPSHESYVYAILYAAVAAIGIAAVGFKNAKRTHLD